MHKETVNTFIKGMVKDTHPLTTPADILTDCLNGTVITYNGNEMILQNDMGNVQIGTAGLKEGYVPVGITEYGGIIYVASYNPKDKIGEIGSFPAPQQNFTTSEWNVNDTGDGTSPTFNYSQFYATNSSTIVTTQITIPLGQSNNEDYIIHTGDKFQISTLESIGIAGKVKTQLAILKKDGTLEILDDSYISNSEQVYRGKSSGHLVVIIKLLTLQSFNLERKYSRATIEGQPAVRVDFIGSYELEEGSNPTSVSLYDLNSSSQSGNSGLERYVISPMSGTYTYNFCPELNPQGILISMAKTGTIDFSKFKNEKAEIKDWSYYIADNYIKLNWSFDYYSLDSTSQVQAVIFDFYGLDNTEVAITSQEIIKDSFNGSFEEVISFDDKIKRNEIYVVKVSYKVGVDYTTASTSDKVFKRVLYTSGILNQYYGKVKDFVNSKIIEAGADSVTISSQNYPVLGEAKIHLEVIPEIKNVNNPENLEELEPEQIYKPITITDPYENQSKYLNYRELRGSNFIVSREDRGLGYYKIDVQNKYKLTSEIIPTTTLEANCIGYIGDDTIKGAVEAYAQAMKVEIDDSEIERYGNDRTITHDAITITVDSENTISYIYQGDPIPDTEPEEQYDKNLVIFPEFTDSRTIKINTTEPKSKVVEKEGLVPLYRSSWSNTEKDKVFSSWNKNKMRMCSGADSTNIHYNCSLAGSVVNRGVDTGAGCDDTGLNTAMEHMELPMVSIFAGCDGDEASYSPRGFIQDKLENDSYGYLHRINVAGWNCSNNEIDGTDNFLIAVWKQSDNKYRFCDLASQRKYSSNTGKLVRLDYMLRCLLSQIFVKQHYKETLRYISINNDTLTYTDGITKIKTDFEENQIDPQDWNEIKGYDLMYDNSHTIHEMLDAFNETDEPEWRLDVRYNINVIPTIKSTTFGEDFYIEYINNMLNSSEYELEAANSEAISPNIIYVADWSKIANTDYEFNDDKSIEWKRTDFENMVRVSGTGGTTDDGMTTYTDFDATAAPFSVNAFDILKTWNNESSTDLKWLFYHSFNYMFVTTCQLNNSTPQEGQFNEIVMNVDSDFGSTNTSGRWRKGADASAPDITALLGNYYNSIYGYGANLIQTGISKTINIYGTGTNKTYSESSKSATT